MSSIRENIPGKRVVLLKCDPGYCSHVRAYIDAALPGCTVIEARRISAVDALLAVGPIDLLVTELFVDDGDVTQVMPDWLERRGASMRVLVTSNRNELHVLNVIWRLAVGGYFDQSEEPGENLRLAIQAVAEGGRYWSPQLCARILRECVSPNSLYARLTPREKLILAAVGDGSDNRAAANSLQMAERQIQNTREQLHSKLGVQHKGELAMWAVKLGLVCFERQNLYRPGYSILVREAAKSRRPVRLQRHRELSFDQAN